MQSAEISLKAVQVAADEIGLLHEALAQIGSFEKKSRLQACHVSALKRFYPEIETQRFFSDLKVVRSLLGYIIEVIDFALSDERIELSKSYKGEIDTAQSHFLQRVQLAQDLRTECRANHACKDKISAIRRDLTEYRVSLDYGLELIKLSELSRSFSSMQLTESNDHSRPLLGNNNAHGRYSPQAIKVLKRNYKKSKKQTTRPAS